MKEKHNLIVNEIVNQFRTLTRQTKRNSEKMLFELINSNSVLELKELLIAIDSVFDECPNCFYFLVNGYCESCMNEKRNSKKICVVSTILDAKNIIDKDVFDGVFHVIKGEIDINKNLGASELKIGELFDRIKDSDKVEVIVALNATFKGEITSNYLIQELLARHIKVSRLARGIPFGGMVNYVDKETIKNALKNRDKF
jgi:recombination protein RecR